jgi:hypothetical protein
VGSIGLTPLQHVQQTRCRCNPTNISLCRLDCCGAPASMLYASTQGMKMCQQPRPFLFAARSCASQVSWVSNDRTAFTAKAAPISTRLPLRGLQLYHSRSVHCRAAAPQSTKLDSSMIWGDIMMLTATELASERLPKQVTGVLSLTLLAAWIGVSRWWYCCGKTISIHLLTGCSFAGGNCKG